MLACLSVRACVCACLCMRSKYVCERYVHMYLLVFVQVFVCMHVFLSVYVRVCLCICVALCVRMSHPLRDMFNSEVTEVTVSLEQRSRSLMVVSHSNRFPVR